MKTKESGTVTTLSLRSATAVDKARLAGQEGRANENAKPRSTLLAKNVRVNGRRTSVRMEPEVWSAISEITRRENLDRNNLFTTIANRLKPHQTLSSAVRAFIITYYRESSTESGHVRAGHGPTDRR